MLIGDSREGRKPPPINNLKKLKTMLIRYTIKDKDDNVIMSDYTKVFVTESDFRSYIKKDMRDHFTRAHYCEYIEWGVSARRKMRTVANF